MHPDAQDQASFYIVKGQLHHGANKMAVLNTTEIMGQDIARCCVKRVIILGCVVAVPFLGHTISPGQKITQRCVAAWAGAFPR